MMGNGHISVKGQGKKKVRKDRQVSKESETMDMLKLYEHVHEYDMIRNEPSNYNISKSPGCDVDLDSLNDSPRIEYIDETSNSQMRPTANGKSQSVLDPYRTMNF